MPEAIAGVEVPEMAAVAESARLIQETTNPLIYHHSRRFSLRPDPHSPARFPLHHGFSPAAADTVWTAIALHTTPGIPDRMGPEIATSHLGVLTDAIGLDLAGLDTDQVEEILARTLARISRTNSCASSSPG